MKKVFLLNFFLWILFGIFKISGGVLCVFCNDVTSLLLCNNLKSCEVGWKCFSQSWLNENETRFYTKGCYNPTVKECEQFTDNCLPTKPLLKCCQTDLCNVGNPFSDWKPREPDNITITNMSKTSIKIQWENQCEDLYSYQIVYFLNQTDNPSILMTLNLTGENSAVIDSLSKGRYIFSIRSFHFNKFSKMVLKIIDIGDTKEEDIALSRTNLLIISIVVALIIFICLVVVVVICVRRKRRKNRDSYVVDRIYEVPSTSRVVGR